MADPACSIPSNSPTRLRQIAFRRTPTFVVNDRIVVGELTDANFSPYHGDAERVVVELIGLRGRNGMSAFNVVRFRVKPGRDKNSSTPSQGG